MSKSRSGGGSLNEKRGGSFDGGSLEKDSKDLASPRAGMLCYAIQSDVQFTTMVYEGSRHFPGTKNQETYTILSPGDTPPAVDSARRSMAVIVATE